jgi:hypothetical protein
MVVFKGSAELANDPVSEATHAESGGVRTENGFAAYSHPGLHSIRRMNERYIEVVHALAFACLASSSVAGCHGELCTCYVDAAAGVEPAPLYSEPGQCTPRQADAGCVTPPLVGGPLIPPELADLVSLRSARAG